MTKSLMQELLGETKKSLATSLRPAVSNSYELQRIMDLPRRALDLSQETVDAVNRTVRRSGAEMSLWPIQTAALVEAAEAGGLFAPIGVGHGKTLITLLLPLAMNSKSTVLLVPAQLKKQLAKEMPEYAKHFHIDPEVIKVFSYSQLSSAKGAMALEEAHPDLIVADEAHKLRRFTSARTKRFMRYMKANPNCRFCGLSGTMTTRSLVDYAHLVELALRKGSPVPNSYYTVQDWCGAIDVDPKEPRSPGALRKLCKEGESVRAGFRRRLVETKGVVATEEGALGTSLIVREAPFKGSEAIKKHIQLLNNTWKIGEDEIESALHAARAKAQLSCGFFYKWEWPDGKDQEWIDKRAEWHTACRQWLSTKARAGLDSPFLLTCAIKRGDIDSYTSKAWKDWKEVKDRPGPDTVAQWVCDSVIQYCIKWADKNKGIIWYKNNAVGEELGKYLPLYDSSKDASQATEDVIVCSIRAHGTGKNMQQYNNNLILSLPPNGTTVEQLFGRTHRPGQKEDEVFIDLMMHTDYLRNTYTKATADAEYMEETTGQKQKILYATKIIGKKRKQGK